MNAATWAEAATILLPVDRGTLLPAGDDWTEPLPRRGPAVWGGPPGERVDVATLRHALFREARVAYARLRSPRGHIVHRLAPSPVGRADSLRRVLLGGVAVEIGRGHRRIDAVAAAAGAAPNKPLRVLGFGAGGALIARVEVRGHDAILRAARAGGPGDPERGADVLRALLAHGGPPRPQSLGSGVFDGVAWAVETRLPGRRPRRLSDAVVRELCTRLAELPRPASPPVAPVEDLRQIAGQLPTQRDRLLDVAARLERECLDLPSIGRHGDLWLGNLLCDGGGSLTGVVDWDAWHPSGVPGTDLLQLLGTEKRHRERLGLGEVWRTQWWRGEEFRARTRTYWDRLGLAVDDVERVLGISWWAGEVAGTLRRYPRRATDTAWLAAAVDRVVDAI